MEGYIYIIYIYIADLAEWSISLDIRISDWNCNISMMCVQNRSRENNNLLAQKSKF